MSSSHAEIIRRGAAGVFVAAFLAIALPARSQTADMPLPHPLGGPTMLPVEPSEKPEAPKVDTGPAPAKLGEIQVDYLGQLNVDAAGALAKANGSLGTSMWRGTKRSLAEELLPHLPVKADSPAMRDLMRRLLLSSATPPEGEGKPGSLVALRARLLAEMGDISGAASLIKAIPKRVRSSRLIKMQMDASLLAGDASGACTLASSQIRRWDDPYWQKVLVFCQFLAGDTKKAQLGISLLQEQGEDDAAFYRLAGMQAGAGALFPKEAEGGKLVPGIADLPDPTPLHIAMARTVGVALPVSVTDASRPLVLQALAMDVAQPLEIRLKAGEKAEAMGALPTAALRDLYGDLDDSVAAQESGGVWGQALLFHAALGQTAPAARAEAISAALLEAKKNSRYASAARILMPAIEGLAPAVNLVWLAPDMVRALLINGRLEQASAWYRLIRDNASFNQRSDMARRVLKPLMRIAGSPQASDWKPRNLQDWWQAVEQREQARTQAAMVFTMLAAFNNVIPDSFWAPLAQGPESVFVTMPHAFVWRSLETASRRGRLAETVLLSLISIGEKGPGSAYPAVLGRAVRSLRAVGLEAEARALAAEAVMTLSQ